MKRILLTGAAQGIGRSIAELLLTDPAVHLVVIDKQKTSFVEELLQKYGERFSFYLQDIAERDNLSNVLAKVGAGKLDAIVNDAGEVYLEKWPELKLGTWDRTLAVNVTAPLQIVHELKGSLLEGASIVNVASVDGYCAAFDTVAYAASKAALISLTKSLAAILGERNIRVNAVAPGWVETEMTKGTLPKEATWITPLHRNAQAEDVAEVVCFLLSEKAKFINGETIVIDGGLTVVDYTLKQESIHNIS